MEFESVIGLEVHVQLSTLSKAFARSATTYGASPNSLTDPVTLGLPGALPVLNRQVVEYAIMLGLATGCEIRTFNRFARKHYFYPDLPKGYQISQFDEPICERGSIKVALNDAFRTIGITRIHIEEDAGKNIHDSRTQSSLIDLNRAGVPLLEVVSEPDLRTAEEASAYLKTVRQLVRYLGICDGNMEEGSLRCDANISVRPFGDQKLGTRAEIKNINSFKFVERAIEYEIARQIALLKAGGQVIQETRLFDSASGSTQSMRGKEGSADYRYFPDPDLPPLVVEEHWINEIRSRMPTLPAQARNKMIETYALTPYDAAILTSERQFYDYFEEVFHSCGNAKAASNWITSELFGVLNKKGINLSDCKVKSSALGSLIKLIDSETISGKIAKQVFEEMIETGEDPVSIVEKKGLKQLSDPNQALNIINQVLDSNPSQLSAYLAGKQGLFGFFVGQAIKLSSGTLNPKLVNDLLQIELEKRKK